MDLGHNTLGVEGARRFAECLKENKTLQYVNLEWNAIETAGLVAIVNALKSNPDNKLQVLDVHSNRIDAEGAKVYIFIIYYLFLYIYNLLFTILYLIFFSYIFSLPSPPHLNPPPFTSPSLLLHI